jgi:hypothetical protein
LAKQNVYNLGKEIEYAKRLAEEDRKLLASLRSDHESLVKQVEGIEQIT